MPNTPSIYLDHAATTPLHPKVKEAMADTLEAFGNPSSLHSEGRKSKQIIDQAREKVSRALGCEFAEIIFTSGGTEASHLAIIGAALANQNPNRNRIILSSVEHHCVLGTETLLTKLGYQVELIPVTRNSIVDLGQLESILNEQTLLVSLMSANNETGAIQPIQDALAMTKNAGALFHSDHVQGFKKEVPNPIQQGADLLTVSAHKINGPKGVGATYVRAGVKVKPLISGGEQEREQRGGTENLVGISGFGTASTLPTFSVRSIRDTFLDSILQNGAIETTNRGLTLGTHAHVRFPGIDAETILIRLDREGVCASSGAACSSGSVEVSHVLTACGYSETEAREGLRFTFGSGNTEPEALQAAAILSAIVGEIRKNRS